MQLASYLGSAVETAKGRRRGTALEEAILDAAWSELTELGYDAMTLDSVAQRAGTSRPVLHRRWPSRTRLAAAALARYVALHPIDVPDLGSVSAEVSVLLRRMSTRARPDLIRLVFDMHGDLAEQQSSIADLRAGIANDRLMRAILERGIARGELDPERLTPRVVALPTDLMRHEMLMRLEPPSDDAIREIVEDLFMPLVRR